MKNHFDNKKNSISKKTLGFNGVVTDQNEFTNLISKIVEDYEMKQMLLTKKDINLS